MAVDTMQFLPSYEQMERLIAVINSQQSAIDGIEARLNNQISETNNKITLSYSSVKEV